jgi:membrane protein YdbS with pleckstrin-like domain
VNELSKSTIARINADMDKVAKKGPLEAQKDRHTTDKVDLLILETLKNIYLKHEIKNFEESQNKETVSSKYKNIVYKPTSKKNNESESKKKEINFPATVKNFLEGVNTTEKFLELKSVKDLSKEVKEEFIETLEKKLDDKEKLSMIMNFTAAGIALLILAAAITTVFYLTIEFSIPILVGGIILCLGMLIFIWRGKWKRDKKYKIIKEEIGKIRNLWDVKYKDPTKENVKNCVLKKLKRISRKKKLVDKKEVKDVKTIEEFYNLEKIKNLGKNKKIEILKTFEKKIDRKRNLSRAWHWVLRIFDFLIVAAAITALFFLAMEFSIPILVGGLAFAYIQLKIISSRAEVRDEKYRIKKEEIEKIKIAWGIEKNKKPEGLSNPKILTKSLILNKLK